MTLRKIIPSTITVLIFLSACFFPLVVWAEMSQSDCESKAGKNQLSLEEAKQCEVIFEKLYADISSQKRTLQAEIAKFNAAIAVTQTKLITTGKEIELLESQIVELGIKIGKLDISLDRVSSILIRRIVATYKAGKANSLVMLLATSNLAQFDSQLHYLKTAQMHDRELIFQLESVRTDFESQKTLKQEKQTQLEEAKQKLESQSQLLARQKLDKEKLLSLTRNNEARYQQLLSVSRAEIEAIQQIISGRGQESRVGDIQQGQRIATVIPGASACSTGTHLHFEVREGDNVVNPLSRLTNIELIDDSGGDSHSGSGDWQWPLNQPIKFNQGFGSDTSAIRSRTVWYNFHTGIDIASSDLTVKAVKDGVLYRGSIGCGGGTLRYVRVDHNDSNQDTYYLHINY